jgi:hypothetical protein
MRVGFYWRKIGNIGKYWKVSDFIVIKVEINEFVM